jgi:ribosomal protein S27E
MITYREIQTTKKEFESITCDKCGNTYGDEMEAQEFLNIRFRGGYASVFGDETNVSCDICQYCLKELIGTFCICHD